MEFIIVYLLVNYHPPPNALSPLSDISGEWRHSSRPRSPSSNWSRGPSSSTSPSSCSSASRESARWPTSPTEFVAILLISNAVQNSMNGGDNSLSGGLVLAGSLIALSTLISHPRNRAASSAPCSRARRPSSSMAGRCSKNLAKERLSEAELKVLLRKQGIHDLHELAIRN